jgi:hypothetical protein
MVDYVPLLSNFACGPCEGGRGAVDDRAYHGDNHKECRNHSSRWRLRRCSMRGHAALAQPVASAGSLPYGQFGIVRGGADHVLRNGNRTCAHSASSADLLM